MYLVVQFTVNAQFLIIVSTLVILLPARASDNIDISLLPEPVRSTVSGAGVGEAVKEVTIRKVDGRTVYDVELTKDNAPNARLRIAPDGTLLRDSRRSTLSSRFAEAGLSSEYTAGGPTPVIRSILKLEDLPAAAQQTIRDAAGGREIAGIDADTLAGRVAFKVVFREGGRNPRLYVAEDGTLLRPEEKPPALLLGTTFVDTPRAVQQAIRNEARNGEILKIDQDGIVGKPKTYQVEIRDNRGRFQLLIAEEGTIISDSRKGTHPRKNQ